MTSKRDKYANYEPAPWWWRRILPPIGAWVMACLAAATVAVSGVALQSLINTGHLPFTMASPILFLVTIASVMFLMGLITIIPSPIIVWLMRRTRVRRGMAEVIVAAMLALGLSVLIIPISGIGSIASFTAAGAAGGFTYWHFAGRPRPPY
ncbi:MAG: hypothetical protein P8J78_10400 [Maricaulis sp.]|nr:hypothetical protein [Maricaulis sp.]MDG2045012.1 hypothetical protein [Maricaulis sp.]